MKKRKNINRIRGFFQVIIILVITIYFPDPYKIIALQVDESINVFGSWLYSIVIVLIKIWPVIVLILFIESMVSIIFNKNLYQFFKYIEAKYKKW